ncbi:MAG: wax ester/triacylglycerol synthase family O-acyltransferase, partial [Deltaproteobacteria bacterium]|nr:wax ester/triacylglycerol synthase family O-acyltransferase [Deltaproteobacteria bacterium]
MRSFLRNVDASWLRMDDPVNLMVVTGVLVLEAPVPLDRIRALLEKRIVRFRQFTSRVVPPLGGLGLPSWEPDPDFSLDHHLKVARLGPGAGDPALQAFVTELLPEPFAEGRPLWTVHFVEHFGGGSALVARIHHC